MSGFTNQYYFHLLSFALVLVLGHCTSQVPSSRPFDQDEVTLRERHEQWMADHGRDYKDEIEKEKRFSIFKDNIKEIEAFNNNGKDTNLYKLGANAFTDLTLEEFRATHTSNKRQLPSFNSMSTTMFLYENLIDLPSSVDWRNEGAVTPIKNQYNCSSCWAFGAVATVEALHKIKTGELISLSEQELIDCDYENNGCEPGYIHKAYGFIQQNQGLVTENEYPYKGVAGQCNASALMFASSGMVTINGYESVPSYNEYSLMQAVSQQPVAVQINDDRLNPRFYHGGILHGQCAGELNHVVTIIGYDTDPNGHDYWLIKNSWGEQWGENGYARILRDQNVCGIAEFPIYPI